MKPGFQCAELCSDSVPALLAAPLPQRVERLQASSLKDRIYLCGKLIVLAPCLYAFAWSAIRYNNIWYLWELHEDCIGIGFDEGHGSVFYQVMIPLILFFGQHF